MDNIDQVSNTDPFQAGSRHIKWRGGLSKQERSKRSQHYHKNGIGFLFSSNSSTASGALGRSDMENRFRDGSLLNIDSNLHSFKEIVDYIQNLTEIKISIDKISILKQLPVGRQINITQLVNSRINSKIDIIALRLSGSGKTGSFNITLRNRKVFKVSRATSPPKTATQDQNQSKNTLASKPRKDSRTQTSTRTGNYIKGFENLLNSSATNLSGYRTHK